MVIINSSKARGDDDDEDDDEAEFRALGDLRSPEYNVSRFEQDAKKLIIVCFSGSRREIQ
jgi:hypothetical protein